MAKRDGRDRSSALHLGRARLRARKFAQFEALDLAGRGLRQRIDEFDPARIFPRPYRALDVRLEALIERPASALARVSLENHESLRLEQTLGVLRRNDGRFEHIGMADERRLHFERRNPDAAD